MARSGVTEMTDKSHAVERRKSVRPQPWDSDGGRAVIPVVCLGLTETDHFTLFNPPLVKSLVLELYLTLVHGNDAVLVQFLRVCGRHGHE